MSGLSIAPYFPFARMKIVSQNVHVDLENPGTLIHLQPDQRFRPLCHVCGTAGHVHSTGLRRIIRDLNTGPAQTFLQVAYRRVWCSHCQRPESVTSASLYCGVRLVRSYRRTARRRESSRG